MHRHALPVPAAHGFPATLFVSTGWLRGPHDNGGGPDTILDRDQVRELAAAGVGIGGHSPPQLDRLDEDRLPRPSPSATASPAAPRGPTPCGA